LKNPSLKAFLLKSSASGLAWFWLFACKMLLREKVENLEKKEIVSALQESGWMKSRAARRLGITERMLNYRIKKYGIEIRKEIVLK
jgi:DNA-binding NtrC family response regulator